jgi:hypothetical protein
MNWVTRSVLAGRGMKKREAKMWFFSAPALNLLKLQP